MASLPIPGQEKQLVYLDSRTMPTQNNAAWGQRSNRGLIIGIFGLCLGLFGVVCGMFWEDLFNWIKHKVSQVHSWHTAAHTVSQSKPRPSSWRHKSAAWQLTV